MGKIIGALFGGWKMYLGIAILAGIVLGYIGWLKIANANLRAVKAEQASVIETLTKDLLDAQDVNSENAKLIDSREARHKAELAAVVADRDRRIRELRAAKIVKETIHVESQKCVGVPPAGRAVAEWLRNTSPSSD